MAPESNSNENTHPLGQLQECPFHQKYQLEGFLDLNDKNVSQDGMVRGGQIRSLLMLSRGLSTMGTGTNLAAMVTTL